MGEVLGSIPRIGSRRISMADECDHDWGRRLMRFGTSICLVKECSKCDELKIISSRPMYD